MYVPQGFSGRVKEKSFGHHSCSQCFSPHCSATENKTKAHPSPSALSIFSHPLQHHYHITNRSLSPCSHSHTHTHTHTPLLSSYPHPSRHPHTQTPSPLSTFTWQNIYSALRTIRSLARTVVRTVDYSCPAETNQ